MIKRKPENLKRLEKMERMEDRLEIIEEIWKEINEEKETERFEEQNK